MSRDVKSIFGSALEIDAPDRRAAYLNEVCGPDTGLRAEVDGLLAALGKAGDFMRRPAAEVALGKAASHGSLIETPGAMIGPYKLLEQVGEGGMGLVFVAEQQHPVRRRVALKLIKPGMDSRQIVARFEAERQALAMMDHPNIAKVLDGGATPEGGPYFVMELVKGLPITDHCDKNCLGTRQRLELFLDVCHAVQHAHQKGIIHRDLKPSNILVEVHDVRPVAKIIDFGIAKAIGQQLTDKTLYTAMAHLVGTPMYMSPEQAGLSSLDVDTRSDVYSLGVLLYELLTGTTPFENETLKKAGCDEMRRIIREDEPPKPSTRLSTLHEVVLSTICERRGVDLRELRQQVRGELDWIVMKCLEKERDRRFETANDLVLDVQRYLRDEQVQACPPTVGYRLKKFMRRNKRSLVAAALVLLALVVGIIGTTLGMLRATYESNQKEEALAAAQRNERDARAQLFQALWNQARALRHSAQVGARTESLKALDGAAALAQTLDLSDKQMLGLRNEAIACLSQANLTLERQWKVLQPTSRGLGFDAALRLYAFGECTQGEKGDIIVRRVEDDQEVVRLDGALDLRGDPSFHFSADGTRLVARDSADQGLNRTTVWDLQRRQPLFRMTGVLAFDLHPGGRWVAVVLRDHSIRLFDLSTEKHEGTPLPSQWKGPRYPYLCFNAAGTKLVVAGIGTSGVEIWDTPTLSLEKRLTLPEAVSEKPAWHSGSRMLAAAAGHRILLYDLESGQTKRLEGHQLAVTNLAFSVDGDLLTSLSLDSTARLWDVRTGRQLLWTPATPGAGPQFSADGQCLALRYGRTAKIFKMDRSAEFRGSSCRYDGFGNHFSFSPDCRLLCVAGERGVHFWDTVTGEARGLAPLPRSRSVLYDPAGKHLITTGDSGAHLWPVASSREDGGVRLRVGPPEALARAEITKGGDAALSHEGRTFVVCTEDGRASILDVPMRKVTARLTGQQHLAFVSISPDGRWVASSTWHGIEIVVWDAKTGKRVKDWPHFRGLIGKVTFGPEGKWLVTTIGPDYQLIETENWQPRRIIPKESSGDFVGPVAFSDDGKILAVADTPHEVKLLNPDTGREYAALSLPSSLNLGIMRFSPDGSRLAVLTGDGLLHVWDLRRIRQRLAAMKLDWEPPLAPRADADAPVHVEVDLGELHPVRQSLARYRRTLEANPDDAAACNEVAWVYATGPVDLRKPEEALRLARNAVRLAPKEHNYLNTLGVAYYRLGQWKEAEATLQDAAKVDSGKAIAWDQFFLAMCYQHLGQSERALECFRRANEWWQQTRQTMRNVPEQWMAELTLFRAEAAAVLGLPTPAP